MPNLRGATPALPEAKLSDDEDWIDQWSTTCLIAFHDCLREPSETHATDGGSENSVACSANLILSKLESILSWSSNWTVPDAGRVEPSFVFGLNSLPFTSASFQILLDLVPVV